jgi:DNA mismatch endonuclease (patch repair protein)
MPQSRLPKERGDNHTPEQRSRTMSRIKATNTGPELILRRALWKRGLRGYRLHVKGLPGKPDLAWRSCMVAVFVDGAFWHGHRSAFVAGKSGAYWDAKIARNMARDDASNRALEALGWRVIRLWDFQVRRETDECVAQIESAVLTPPPTEPRLAHAPSPS